MYSTLEQLKERIAEKTIQQLTDDDRIGSIDTTRVDAAIARADAEIDAWCGKRYSVPFVTVPPIIREISADLAVYYLYARRSEKMPETRAAAQKDALRALEKIGKGDVSLGVAEIPAAPASNSGATFIGGDRVFNRTSLRDM